MMIAISPITCNPVTGTDPGSITVENLTGGTAEYTYYLTGNNGYDATYNTTMGGEDHTFAILEFGIYEVDVVDVNGCSLRTTNIIASPPDDLDIDVSTATADCATGGTAIVTVSSIVGSNDYRICYSGDLFVTIFHKLSGTRCCHGRYFHFYGIGSWNYLHVCGP